MIRSRRRFLSPSAGGIVRALRLEQIDTRLLRRRYHVRA